MKNIIDAKPGSYFRIEERIYKSIEKPDNSCTGCCFFGNMVPCTAPVVRCDNRVFRDVTFDPETPQLLPEPKKNLNPGILVMTVLFWTAIYFFVKSII
jgi:hypothetical protein